MKNKHWFILLLFFLVSSCLSAQNYTHAVGAVVGSMNGFTYKIIPGDNNVALQFDLAQKFTRCTDFEGSFNMFSVEISPNIMRAWQIKEGNWYYFLGGGAILGYNWWLPSLKGGKFGVHGLTGFECVLPGSPLSLQFDFRPGYSIVFGRYVYGACFDWGLNMSLRYIF